MKPSELKSFIKEAVREAIQEELKDILLEAVRAPKLPIQETYQMSPMGTKGTGEMDVWVKYNPYRQIIRPSIKEENQRVFGWSQMHRNLSFESK